MNRNIPFEHLVNKTAVPRKKDVLYKGIQLRLYSIGWLALLAAISQNTIRLWERNKILPHPIFKLAKNRWYSPRELEVFTQEIRNHYQTGRSLKDLRVRLHQAQTDVKKYYDQLATGKQTEFPRLRDEQKLVESVKHIRIAKMINGFQTQ